jgi:tRNA (guanine37-N1)-methyltransferase
MRVNILTIFPEMINNFLGDSIIKRATDKGIIDVNAVNIRDFSEDKHNRVDDYPFGGDLGMLFKAEPVIRAFNSLVKEDKKPFCIMMSPKGMKFNQEMASELSKKDDIAIICGHYEGIDERVFDNICDLEISIGDFVLTGGELGACVVADAVLRLVDGVLSEENSFKNETHQSPLLEYPQYTRPSVCEYGNVPEILLSGHHKNIQSYRREQSLMATLSKREDLFLEIDFTKEDIKYLEKINGIIEKVIGKV